LTGRESKKVGQPCLGMPGLVAGRGNFTRDCGNGMEKRSRAEVEWTALNGKSANGGEGAGQPDLGGGGRGPELTKIVSLLPIS